MSVTDRDAAARFGVDPPRDHDHRPRYDGEAALWPSTAMDMDRRRYDTDGPCWAMWGPVHDSLTPSKFRWWVDCRDCKARLSASSEEALRRKMAEHTGDDR